jgi:hypothetical protein
VFHEYLSYDIDSMFGVETGCGLDGRGVEVWVPVRERIFSSPRRPDRFWGLPSLLSNGMSLHGVVLN